MDQQDRSIAMLRAVHLEPDGMGPGGRYPIRARIADGVAIWATSIPRESQNQFGVQFTGSTLPRGGRLADEFQRCGFSRRPEADDKVTYCRVLRWSERGEIDAAEAWLVRRAIEGILST